MASFAILDEGFQVTIKSTKSFANTLEGFEKMARWVNPLENVEVAVHYVMEATSQISIVRLNTVSINTQNRSN